MPLRLEVTPIRMVSEPLDVVSVHHEHANFVWLTLQRLGVRDADIEDLLQEVFVVVHQRLHTFDGSARMTTWLFGICLRVASAYRRRAYRRREQSVAEVPEDAATGESPEEAAATAQARARLRAALDLMDLDKRAIFVMFELDELSCEAIAEMLSIPLGTVYSRLHAARKAFEQSLARVQARGAMRRVARPEGGP
ncbi:MAG: sigma-70 family RNA polymerase sigma factor [Polyangiaceae bacterium]